MGKKKTEKRKKDHIDLVLGENICYKKSTELENVELIHCALPEIDFNKIDLSRKFLNKKIKYPLIIEAMTGGFEGAKEINLELAKCAEKFGIGLGLGSQRAMLEDKSCAESYKVRKIAPNIPIIGNVGGFQLKELKNEQVEHLVSDIEADAIAIHLNPLQEVIQPEGDKDFTGILKAIERLCDDIYIPVIVKETGAGISTDVAIKLKRVGVNYIDIAGSGGCSWSKVEYLRGRGIQGFEEWGIPTYKSIKKCKGIIPMIGSGGIRSGIDVVKVIALGCDLGGAAYPFLNAWKEKRLDQELEKWTKQIEIAAFLTGCSTYSDLRKIRVDLKT